MYQELLTPSFPLDWCKVLCTGKAAEGCGKDFQICCKWRCVGTAVTRLAVNARGGASAWGEAIAGGGFLMKQQQLLLLHLLLQWRRNFNVRCSSTGLSIQKGLDEGVWEVGGANSNKNGETLFRATPNVTVSNEPLQILLE